MWHPEVASETALAVLPRLAELGPEWYLAGGTGLALQLGHRRSRDLDFFAPSLFDEATLAQRFPTDTLVSKAVSTLHLEIDGVKVSLFGYEYPLLFPLLTFASANVADARDIACMKLSAIAARGARRDFVDLYAVAQQYPLDQLLELFHRKYGSRRMNGVHLRKSLVYFEDADREPDPDLIQPISWPRVKEYFLATVK
jgi:hypothetical protein